jgi:ATP-binding cassette subfamily C protein CydD
MHDAKKAARAWTKQQTRLGRRQSLPVVAFGLGGIAAAILQAGCLALFLGARLRGLPPALWPLAGFALLALLRAWLQCRADRAAFAAGANGRARLRHDIVARLLAAGPAILRGRHSAELTSAAVDQVEALDGLFARWMPAATLAIAGPALVLLAALATDPVAAAILAGAGLLVPVGQAMAGIGAAAASRGQFLALARLQARFLDRVRGIATIVLAGRADDEAGALARAADELRRRTMRVLRVVFLSSAMLDCALAGALIALALRYRHILAGGHGAASAALFVLLLVPEFFAPLRGFAAAYQDRMHATGAAEALIGLPAAPAAAPLAVIRTVEASGVAIAFQDVSFTWDVSRGPALDGLSFVLPAGEMLVLSGPSGAGKSTVIELLLGFVRPQSGRILLNGRDIADIVPEALSTLTAWIGQKPVLFAGTIRDNIRFARPDASEAEIEEAARQARVSDFAARLPAGLDTPVGEGGHGISGGQAQRVAIARAFLKQAPLLLLDEPTNHLDPATEAEVLASLRRLAVGKTVVMASHTAAAHAFGGRRLELRAGRAAAVGRGAAALGAGMPA